MKRQFFLQKVKLSKEPANFKNMTNHCRRKLAQIDLYHKEKPTQTNKLGIFGEFLTFNNLLASRKIALTGELDKSNYLVRRARNARFSGIRRSHGGSCLNSALSCPKKIAKRSENLDKLLVNRNVSCVLENWH